MIKYSYEPSKQDFGRSPGLRLFVQPDHYQVFVLNFDENLECHFVECKPEVGGLIFIQDLLRFAGKDFVTIVTRLRHLGGHRISSHEMGINR